MEPFGTNFGIQNESKIDEKSIQNSIKISVGFWSGYWNVFAQFWKLWGLILGAKIVDFGSLNASLAHLRRGIHRRPLRHPWFGSIFETILDQFFNDFLDDFLVRFLDHFWTHFERILGA